MEKYQNWELLAKYFAQETTEIEKQQIENWRKESNENELIFNEMKSIWENSKFNEESFNPNFDSAWQKIEKRIDSHQIKKRRVGMTILKYAASILLLLGAYCFIKTQFINPPTELQSELKLIEFYNKDANVKEYILPDSSHVWLRQNTSIQYKEGFEKDRSLSLSGEAFFEVTKDPSHPFSVNVGETKTTVLGTSFNLKEIADNQNVEIAVFSGKVCIASTNSVDSSNHKLLVKGQQAKYLGESNQINFSEIQDPNLTSWKTGVLVFVDNDMEYVSMALTRHYGIDVKVASNNISELSFTSTFKNESFENAIQIIENTLNITALKTNKGIIFTKK